MKIFKLLCLSFAGLTLVQICSCQIFDTLFFERLLRGNSYQQTAECVHDEVGSRPIYFEDDSFSNCYDEVVKNRRNRHPDQDKRVNEVILDYGYDLVTYDNVTTKDGYILTLFRITGGQKSPSKPGKPAVLLFHGLGTASDQWVLQHGDRNLAFKLADDGYDVWLANARGTDFSRRHKTLNANIDLIYWNYSFHEIAIYDFPTVLELMLDETGSEKIFYIGHSMGATIYAIALAETPSLNDKIHASFLLAPALYIGHLYNPYRILTPILELPMALQNLLNTVIGGHMESRNSQMLSPSRLCTPTAMRCGVCGNVLFFLYGYDAPQMNFTNLPNIISKITNTYSLKTLIHFGQNFRSCMFRKFDYGTGRENKKQYGQDQPPEYNLKKLTAPIYIYYGESDNFVPPVDVAKTRDSLPPDTVKGYFRVDWQLFNHVDFTIAKDADLLVYNGILDIMNQYANATS